jgi:hypothetical protein
MDTFAMNMYIVFLLYYIVVRLTRKSGKIFLAFYIPTVILLGIVEWVLNSGLISTYIFSMLAGISIFVECICLIITYTSKKYLKWMKRDWKWFIAGIGSFFLSFLIWNLSLPGCVLCYPNTWFQGHSFWHLGVATSTFFLYVYMRSEVDMER